MNHLRLVASLSIALVSTLGIAGCAAVGPQETPSASASPTPTGDPLGPQPELFPQGTAVDNKPLFDWALRHGIARPKEDHGKWMVESLRDAGFNVAAMQVTPTKSKTGGKADSITISLQIGTSCLIGQRMKDGTYYSSIEKSITSGGCLLGKTREIDW